MDSSSFGEQEGSVSFTEIQNLYSNGATSDTFKVRMNGKWYFLKRPKKEFLNHPLYIAAFEKEFDVSSQIDHPNIARYVQKGEDDEGLYILSEYIEGLTLKDFLETYPDFFKKKANLKKFIHQLLSALEYLHERQILHLDLKPENILITKIDFDVKIVDLGFAYTDSYQYQTSGNSKRYASPEQAVSSDEIDQRADIYSLGLLVLYAYTSSSNKSLADKLPEPYKNCIKKCLADNKEDRFETILSIHEYLAKKHKQKSILYLSVAVITILCVIGSMQFFFYKDKNAPIDISNMDAPHDIMQKTTFETSINYLYEQYGDPKESDTANVITAYTWIFKNLRLNIIKDKESIITISYKLTGDADLVYDDMLSGCQIPNFGIATFGDFFNAYQYDGNFVSWGGKFYVDICFCEIEPNEISIVMGPDRLTDFRKITLSSTRVGLLELGETLTSKIYQEGVTSLNKAEKRILFEEIKKLRIDNITQTYSLPQTSNTSHQSNSEFLDDGFFDRLDEMFAPTPFSIDD